MLHAMQTLFTTIVGFLIAVGFGLVMGIAIGISRAVYDGLYPMMIAFNSIPKVAIVPSARHLVRHWNSARHPDRVPDLLLPDRSQRGDRSRNHRA